MKWQQRDAYSKKTGSDWCWEGLAIATGKTSGVFVLDSDGPEGEAQIKKYGAPHTWKVRTGKGYQRYYRLPEGIEIPNKIRLLPEIDLKGERGIAVVPPSVHYNGKRYYWVNSPFDTPLADPPAWLINTLKLALGEGLTTEEEYSTIPQEVVNHLRNIKPKRSSGGSGGSAHAKGDPFQEEISPGQRNDTLFRKACYWRYLGFEEEEIYQKLLAYNGIYCDPNAEGELLSAEEIKDISRSACQYTKGKSAPLEVLRAIEAVAAYYQNNPPKGMAQHTDQDITQAFLEEALLHSSIVEDGIEVSISYGSLADKAGCSDSTLRKSLKERLFKSGRFRKGKKPEGTRVGTLILVTSAFYATSAHSISNGLNAPRLHKTPIDDVKSRWGKNKNKRSRLGKAQNHLLKVIEEFVNEAYDALSEGEFTPKHIVARLNEGVTDPKKMVKSSSLSRHFASMCEKGVLVKVRRGVYRLDPERYESLGVPMRASGGFDSIYNQRAYRKRRQGEYKRYLDSLGVDSLGVIDDEEPDPEVIEKIMEWNEKKDCRAMKDWREIQRYVVATRSKAVLLKQAKRVD